MGNIITLQNGLLIDQINEIHDIECNQKYNGKLPYSFHLNHVTKFGKKYMHLAIQGLDEQESVETRDAIILGCQGHDLIEDARQTYNDVAEMLGRKAADIIYLCTELRGRNRLERHGVEYVNGLKSCKLATYVKLCDIMANATFSLHTNSSMFEKYSKEFMHFHKELYVPEYKEMFDFLVRLFSVEDEFYQVRMICYDFGIDSYVIHLDHTVDTDDDVDISDKLHKYDNEIPIQFGKVGGNFICDHNNLTILVGAPKEVGSHFSCRNNLLSSLKGAPQKVGGNFLCHHNKLETMEYCPRHIGGGLDCSDNELTSLEEAMITSIEYIYCDNNKTKIDTSKYIKKG